MGILGTRGIITVSNREEIYFVENCFNYLGCVHPIQDLLDENVRPVRLVDSTRNEDP